MFYRNIYIFICIFVIAFILFITCRKFKVYKIISKVKGPRILLLGGTHGNEEASSIALNRIIYLHKLNRFAITKGSLTIIPSFNKCGLLLNSRYYSKLGKNYDLNRLYGKNFMVNKVVENMLGNIDIIVDLHEGWGFHKINNKSIGNTIITKNIKKKNINFIINRVNKNIVDDYKKIAHLSTLKNKKHSLRDFFLKKFPKKKYILIETSGQNNIQKLDIRVNQSINIIESIFSIYNIIK
jgi:hypothetical protein